MTTAGQRGRVPYDDFPEGWRRRRLRFDVCLNPKKSPLDMEPDELVSFIPMDAVGEYGGLDLDDVRELEEVYDGYTYFAEGDLCIAKITPCFENGKGALAEGLTNGVGFGTTELHVVRPGPNLDRRFLFYVSIAVDFRKLGESEMYGAGGQKRIDEGFIKDWMPPLPSLDTQRRIARFLDEKTAQIDRLIEKKRALLDRLAEKRQALITRAVTKGLNPEDPMKPSDIGARSGDPRVAEGDGGMSYFARSDELPEWAVHVPKDWGNNWLKWSVDLSTKRPTEEEQEALPYISNEDIASWTGKLLIEEPKPAEADSRRFRVNDVLFNKLRPYLAKVYHATFDGVSSGELLCLRPSHAVEPRFLFYVLASKGFIDTINAETFGAKMPRADWEIVGHQPLPLPPLDTQRQIARFLDEKAARIDRVIERIEDSVVRLEEYRSAQVTAAVTGQLTELL